MMRAALLASAAAVAFCSGAEAQQVPAINAGPTSATADYVAVSGGAGPQSAAAIPKTMPPPLPTMSPAPPLARREARAVAMARRWRLRSCGTGMGADGVLEVQHGACEPTLVCAPFRWCDVALEPGEGPTDMPDIGDPRWQHQLRWSVQGMKRTLHIRFRPTDAGLDSNFVVNTNQRTVSLRLVSQPSAYMPFLKLSNPNHASRNQWARAVAEGAVGATAPGRACEGVPTVPPSAFAIEVPSRARSWGPLQVYGVTTPAGARTCIEFPADIGSMDLPTLVVRDAGGAHQLITSQMVGRRMEVDALIGEADLVTGVGGQQTAVSIKRRVQQ